MASLVMSPMLNFCLTCCGAWTSNRQFLLSFAGSVAPVSNAHPHNTLLKSFPTHIVCDRLVSQRGYVCPESHKTNTPLEPTPARQCSFVIGPWISVFWQVSDFRVFHFVLKPLRIGWPVIPVLLFERCVTALSRSTSNQLLACSGVQPDGAAACELTLHSRLGHITAAAWVGTHVMSDLSILSRLGCEMGLQLITDCM